MPIDMSLATKAPPRKTAGRSNARTQPVQQSEVTSVDRRTKGLLEIAQMGQGIALLFGQYADAAAIGQHFPPVATELSKVADTSEIVAKPIDFLIEVGPYGALIAAVVPLALQIAANHGMVDASRLYGQGIMPPDVLEAQMRAEVAQLQTRAMKAHQEALRQAEAAQREFDEMMSKAA